MKQYRYSMAVLLASVLLLLTACRSSRVVQPAGGPQGAATGSATELLQRVCSQAAADAIYVSSKMKFTATVGGKEVTLSGTLRMKRNDVIRLQLMPLGLVEAARMEFTQDYVLIMDRINKQYVKAAYADVDFLRDSGLSFSSLQALFWGELFQPGQPTLGADALLRYDTAAQGQDETLVSFRQTDRQKMSYTWLVDNLTARIKRVSVTHSDARHGDTTLDWTYREFKPLTAAATQFPSDVQALVNTPQKSMKVDIKLSSLTTDSDWETRTKVSGKYRQVEPDDILQRLTSLH